MGLIYTWLIYTGSIYTGSIYTGSIYTGSIYTGSIYTGSIYTGSINTGSIYTGSIYTWLIFVASVVVLDDGDHVEGDVTNIDIGAEECDHTLDASDNIAQHEDDDLTLGEEGWYNGDCGVCIGGGICLISLKLNIRLLSQLDYIQHTEQVLIELLDISAIEEYVIIILDGDEHQQCMFLGKYVNIFYGFYFFSQVGR